MTIEQPVVLDVGPEEFSVGLSYTGSSRTRNFTNLAFDPMPSFNRILKIFTRPSFKEKEAEVKRRDQMVLKRLAEAVQEAGTLEGQGEAMWVEPGLEEVSLLEEGMDLGEELELGQVFLEELGLGQKSPQLEEQKAFVIPEEMDLEGGLGLGDVFFLGEAFQGEEVVLGEACEEVELNLGQEGMGRDEEEDMLVSSQLSQLSM